MKHLVLFFSLVVSASLSSHAGQYFQDFTPFAVGATNFGDGSLVDSDHPGTVAASVQDGTFKELALSDAGITEARSAFVLPDLDGEPVYAFSAKWNASIYRTTTNDADGFSFNFGQLPPFGVLSGFYAQEAGYNAGLSLGVPTYRDNAPGFALRLYGNVIASITNNPNTFWGLTNSLRHFFEVDWNYASGLTLRVDGQTIFTNVSTTGFVPTGGDRFVWAARTGQFTEQTRLDNIIVTTGGTLSQVAMTSPYYKSGELPGPGQTADKAFDNIVITKWLTLSNAGYVGATCLSTTAPSVRVYSLTAAEDIPSRDPKNWTLEGSNNSGTNWSVCATNGGFFTATNRNETRAWLATNSTPFAAYRLNVATNNGGAQVQLSELHLFQFNAFTGPGLYLTIQAAEDNAVVIWELAPAYHLDFSTNLVSGAWISNTALPVVNGRYNFLTIPIDSETKFFRLRKQ